MADRIVVMRDGRILQVGTPMELYERPADVFTARFIGSPTMNILSGRVKTSGGQSAVELAFGAPIGLPGVRAGSPDVLVGVRPQDLAVFEGEVARDRLALEGRVSVVEPLGSEAFVHVEAATISSSPVLRRRTPPQVGSIVRLGASIESIRLFDAKTEQAL